jgi:hypothetical protein
VVSINGKSSLSGIGVLQDYLIKDLSEGKQRLFVDGKSIIFGVKAYQSMEEKHLVSL